MNHRKKLNFVYCGTAKFASDILEILIKNDYIPQFIITMPDKKIGRKQILTEPEVKKIANKFNIKIFQFQNLKEEKEKILSLLKKYNIELNIVAQYGKIIPIEILNFPFYKSINIHGSLLEKYRGASPVQTALLNNESYTGITLIQMDEKMDHGPILAQEKIKIEETDNTYTLLNKLAILGAYLLIKNLNKYLDNEIILKKQDENQVTFSKIIKKEDGFININKEDERQIYNKYRAYYKWPGIYIIWNKKILKLIEIEYNKCKDFKRKNNIFYYNNKKELFLKTTNKNHCLKVKKIQFAGKRIIDAIDFINSQKNNIIKIQ